MTEFGGDDRQAVPVDPAPEEVLPDVGAEARSPGVCGSPGQRAGGAAADPAGARGAAANAAYASPPQATSQRPVAKAVPAAGQFVMPFERGEVLAGKYRVDDLLGVGGIGYVIAATHTGLDEPVAIKLLRPEYAKNDSAVARFTIEAKATFRLNSAHIVRVLDVDTLPDGAPMMVMERLFGACLRTVLSERGLLTVEIAVDYTLQACVALATAHAVDIVHRDVKPDNLFLTRADGMDRIKVLDFGISKVALADPSWTELWRQLSSDSVGSPPYMAPEQIQDANTADPRTDVWALGCVLYELLTGFAPFERATTAESCAAVLNAEPQSLHTHRRVPAELASVVSRCLQKAPSDRFQTVADLAAALAPFAKGLSPAYVDHAREQLRDSQRPGPPEVRPAGAATAPPGSTLVSPPRSGALTEQLIRQMAGHRRRMGARALLFVLAPLVLIAAGMLLVRERASEPQQHVVTPAVVSSETRLRETQPPGVPQLPRGETAGADPMAGGEGAVGPAPQGPQPAERAAPSPHGAAGEAPSSAGGAAERPDAVQEDARKAPVSRPQRRVVDPIDVGF